MSELQKLQTFLSPNNIISKDLIKSIYLSKSRVDDVYETIIFNKAQNITVGLNDLINSQSPLYLIASLQSKLREALRLRLCLETSMSAEQISKLTGLHPYKIQIELKRLKNISSSQLEKILNTLSTIEFKVKSGALKDNQALDLFVLNSVKA